MQESPQREPQGGPQELSQQDLLRVQRETMELLRDIDPTSEMMAAPHRHEPLLNNPRRQSTVRPQSNGRRQFCRCGAQRDIALLISGNWTGGQDLATPWLRAHLEAVLRAVDQEPELLDWQETAALDLNRTLLQDPPEGTENRDLEALCEVYQTTLGATRRVLDWHRRRRQ